MVSPKLQNYHTPFFIANNLKTIKMKISVDINFMGYYISITLEFEVFQCSDPNIIDI